MGIKIITAKVIVLTVLLAIHSMVSAAVLLPTFSESGYTVDGGFGGITTPITSSLIIDNNINTGIVLYGNEAYNSNGLFVEYGAFARFDFNVGNSLDQLTLNTSISSNVRTTSGGNISGGFVNIRVWDYSSNSSVELYSNGNSDISDGIDSHSLTFTANGNNNPPYPEIGLSDIVSSDGLVTFLAYGPFYSSIDKPGLPELYLNEINVVTSVVPIPSAFWLFGSGLIGLTGLARRKS